MVIGTEQELNMSTETSNPTCPDCREVYGPAAHECAVSGGTRCPKCNDLCPDNEVEDNVCIGCHETALPEFANIVCPLCFGDFGDKADSILTVGIAPWPGGADGPSEHWVIGGVNDAYREHLAARHDIAWGTTGDEMRSTGDEGQRSFRWKDANGNVWYWTGHTWTSDTLASTDSVQTSLPGQAGPFTRLT